MLEHGLRLREPGLVRQLVIGVHRQGRKDADDHERYGEFDEREAAASLSFAACRIPVGWGFRGACRGHFASPEGSVGTGLPSPSFPLFAVSCRERASRSSAVGWKWSPLRKVTRFG